MKVIAIGCGRVGSRLATALALRGDSVTVVDLETAAFDRLGKQYHGQRITGDGCNRDVLDRAGIERVDALAAVTGSDEVNAVLARLAATRLKVPRVVARIYAPAEAEIYRRLGVLTISPVTWGVERLTELLTFSQISPVASIGTGQVEIVDVRVPALLDERTAAELTVPGETQPLVGMSGVGPSSVARLDGGWRRRAARWRCRGSQRCPRCVPCLAPSRWRR